MTVTTVAASPSPPEADWSASSCVVPVSLDVHRRWLRLPRNVRNLIHLLHCQRGLPLMVGDGDLPAGSRVAVVAGGRFSRQDLSTVVAIATERQWTLEVVGAADTTAFTNADVADSAGAIGVARSIEAATGLRPAWDVVHGPNRAAALRAFVGSNGPAALVVPHEGHGIHATCPSVTLAGRVGVPVLLI